MARPDRYLAATLAEEADERWTALLACPANRVYRLRPCGWPRTDQWATDVHLLADAPGAGVRALDTRLRWLGEQGNAELARMARGDASLEHPGG